MVSFGSVFSRGVRKVVRSGLRQYRQKTSALVVAGVAADVDAPVRPIPGARDLLPPKPSTQRRCLNPGWTSVADIGRVLRVHHHGMRREATAVRQRHTNA